MYPACRRSRRSCRIRRDEHAEQDAPDECRQVRCGHAVPCWLVDSTGAWKVEQQHFRVAARVDAHLGFVLDAHRVAGAERRAVHARGAARDVHVGAAARCDRVHHATRRRRTASAYSFASWWITDGAAPVRQAPRGARAVRASPRRSTCACSYEGAIPVCAGSIQICRKCTPSARRRVELAVQHAAARAHALHVARRDDRAVAHAVLVRQLPVEHVGNDLHVAVAVRAEAHARLHAVLVDHAQRAEAHVRRIVVVGKRKAVDASRASRGWRGRARRQDGATIIRISCLTEARPGRPRLSCMST